MLKIKKITIENFRGIKLPLTIDFVNSGNRTSALIYGRNGTGKSSFMDAWEWLTRGEIQGLKMEGISVSDYPHKSCNGENSYIRVEFDHPTLTFVKLAFNKNKITSPIKTGNFPEFLGHTRYPNHLRYSDLREFIYMSKTEKYKYIARYFGLDVFIKNQADLQTGLTKLKRNEDHYVQLRDSAIAEIKRIIGNIDPTETNIMAYFSSIAQKYSIAVVATFAQSTSIKNGLRVIVNENPAASELAQWQAFQTRLNQFYPIAGILTESRTLETIFNDLKKDERQITQLFLVNLYGLGLEMLEKIGDKSICPLCDQKFSGDLTQHIEQKYTALNELRFLKEDFEVKKNSVIQSLETFQRKFSMIHYETSEIVLQALNSFFSDTKIAFEGLPNIINILKKELSSITRVELSANEAINKIDELSRKGSEIKKLVSDKIKDLSDDQHSRSLADDFANISTLYAVYVTYLKTFKQVGYLGGLVTKTETLLTSLTIHIQTQIQQIFSSIQTNVVDYYNFIESSNEYLKNPQIKLLTGRDKAIELEIEFIDERVTPAFKFMSESQINSFGLAIFLAAVRHFNSNFKFILLDDVVNSFDAHKRPKISQLLAQKFGDFQFLILTHDQIFRDIIQEDFPNWKRYKMTGWDFATGPRIGLSANYTEEIQNEIDQDNPRAAGSTLGNYLEWTLGRVCESMETPLKYRVDGSYTLADYYSPLVKRLNDKLRRPNLMHNLTRKFDELDSATSFRNYCTHWKNEPSPRTTIEMKEIFDKWMEIQGMLHCPNCKTFVGFQSVGSSEFVRCICGTLDLKTEQYYS